MGLNKLCSGYKRNVIYYVQALDISWSGILGYLLPLEQAHVAAQIGFSSVLVLNSTYKLMKISLTSQSL